MLAQGFGANDLTQGRKLAAGSPRWIEKRRRYAIWGAIPFLGLSALVSWLPFQFAIPVAALFGWFALSEIWLWAITDDQIRALNPTHPLTVGLLGVAIPLLIITTAGERTDFRGGSISSTILSGAVLSILFLIFSIPRNFRQRESRRMWHILGLIPLLGSGLLLVGSNATQALATFGAPVIVVFLAGQLLRSLWHAPRLVLHASARSVAFVMCPMTMAVLAPYWVGLHGSAMSPAERGHFAASRSMRLLRTSQEPPKTVLVPAGPFTAGCSLDLDADCDKSLLSRRTVELPAFEIDKFEVTVADFGQCVRAGACSSDNLTMPFYGVFEPFFMEGRRVEILSACNWSQPGRDSHPINCVSWYQASAYCQWAGKRLPTDLEWEKAARGADGRRFPWGDASFDSAGAVANIPDETLRSATDDDVRVVAGVDDGYATTSPVGSFPRGASPYGACDMVGNVEEWVLSEDTSQPERFASPTKVIPQLARGGSWLYVSGTANLLAYSPLNPLARRETTGFRCVREVFAE